MRSAIAILALVLTACASAPRAEPASPSPPVSKRTQELTLVLAPGDRRTHTVGPKGEKTYGWAEYEGKAAFLDNEFTAEMLVANDYVKGNGTFEGFVTLESPEGDIGLRITGVSTAGAQGDGSAYSGETEVIGGTRTYDTLAGRGRFTGERTGAPDTPVSVQVSLELINPK